LNNDFCTKHNLSFFQRGIKKSQQRFLHNKGKVALAGKAAEGGGTGLKPLPSLGLVFPLL
jgi:hypothetical protein